MSPGDSIPSKNVADGWRLQNRQVVAIQKIKVPRKREHHNRLKYWSWIAVVAVPAEAGIHQALAKEKRPPGNDQSCNGWTKTSKNRSWGTRCRWDTVWGRHSWTLRGLCVCGGGIPYPQRLEHILNHLESQIPLPWNCNKFLSGCVQCGQEKRSPTSPASLIWRATMLGEVGLPIRSKTSSLSPTIFKRWEL